MNLKFTLAGLIVVALTFPGQAQESNIHWSQKIFNPTISTDVYSNVVSVHDMNTDLLKNIYVAGQYGGQIAFDKSAKKPELISTGPEDLYLSKYDETGKHLWTNTIACKRSRIYKIAIGKDNTIYIAGIFNGEVDFDPGEGSTMVKTASNNFTGAAFIAQYNNDGTFKKVIELEGVSIVTDFEIDTEGNLVVAGSFAETIDFDPDAGEAYHTSSGTSGGYSVFFAKYNKDLIYINSKSLHSSYHIGQANLELNANNGIYLAGTYQQTADFDPSPATFLVESTGYADIFLASYNEDLSFNWVKSIGSENWESLNAFEMDNDANIYMVITYKGTVDFDPESTEYKLSSIEKGQFFGKYDITGKLQWGKSVGENSVHINAMTSKSDGAVLLTGYLIGSCDFDPGAEKAIIEGSQDYFFAEYDNSGNYSKAFVANADGTSSGVSVLTDANGDVYLAGVFSGDVDFDPGYSEHVLAAGQTLPAAFLVKYSNSIALTTISADEVENIVVYPNPSKKEFHFSLPDKRNYDMQLINAQGKTVYEETFYGDKKTILHNIDTGIYFIMIKDEYGKIFQGKVIFE